METLTVEELIKELKKAPNKKAEVFMAVDFRTDGVRGVRIGENSVTLQG